MSNSRSEVFAIIGNPVEESLSPTLHNSAFSNLGMNSIYVAFRVVDLKRALDGMRALSIKGFSVTIPHKEAVIEYLDWIHPTAEKMQAVNTIVNEKGILKGYNTDGMGAYHSFLERGLDPKGKSILILGNGGTARAIAHAFLESADPKRVYIAGRNPERVDRLLADLSLFYETPLVSLSLFPEVDVLKEVLREVEIVIQTTPLGMQAESDSLPIPKGLLNERHWVLDVVYHRGKTPFLKDAEDHLAHGIEGLSMLLNQGVLQFELWTKRSAPKEIMRKALYDVLGSDSF